MPHGAIFGVVIGLAVGVCGFVVMQDPMKLSMLAPGEAGYYQRLVLDRWSRISQRLFGLLICLFGSVILSAAAGSLPGLSLLKTLSNGLMVEMGMLFAGLWVFGVVLFIVQAIRGHALDWLKLRQKGIELGPIAVYPPVTAAMSRESRIVTMSFFILLAVALLAAIWRP